jgi:hypothetical protein
MYTHIHIISSFVCQEGLENAPPQEEDTTCLVSEHHPPLKEPGLPGEMAES